MFSWPDSATADIVELSEMCCCQLFFSFSYFIDIKTSIESFPPNNRTLYIAIMIEIYEAKNSYQPLDVYIGNSLIIFFHMAIVFQTFCLLITNKIIIILKIICGYKTFTALENERD